MPSRGKFVCLLVIPMLCAAGAATAAAQAQSARVSAEAARAETAAARVRWSEVRVECEGNRAFAAERLRAQAEECCGRSRQPGQEFEPEFLSEAGDAEGVANFGVIINEGKRFKLRRLAFKIHGAVPEDVARASMPLGAGEVFSQRKFAQGVEAIDALGLFEWVDPNKYAEFRADEAAAELDITIHLTEMGRERPARRAATPEAAGGEVGRPGKPSLARRPQTREE